MSTRDIRLIRQDLKKTCAHQYPAQVAGKDGTIQSPPPDGTLDTWEGILECTQKVGKLVDYSVKPLGRGAFGEVRTLGEYPEIAMKTSYIPPEGIAYVPTSTDTADFVVALRSTEEDHKSFIHGLFTRNAPEIVEPVIHAALSFMMETRRIPPCIPTFIGSYIGLAKGTPKDPWWAEASGGSPRLIDPSPAIFTFMENLAPRRVASMKEMCKRNDAMLNTWSTCILACLTSLFTICGFVHRDLHTDNIMICTAPMKYFGMRIVQHGLPIAAYRCEVDGTFPIFLDFGFSRMIHCVHDMCKMLDARSDWIHHQNGEFYRYPFSTEEKDRDLVWSDTMKFFGSMLNETPADVIPEIVIKLWSDQRVHMAAGIWQDVFKGEALNPAAFSNAKIPLPVLLHAALENFAESLPVDGDMGTDTCVYDIHVDERWPR